MNKGMTGQFIAGSLKNPDTGSQSINPTNEWNTRVSCLTVADRAMAAGEIEELRLECLAGFSAETTTTTSTSQVQSSTTIGAVVTTSTQGAQGSTTLVYLILTFFKLRHSCRCPRMTFLHL